MAEYPIPPWLAQRSDPAAEYAASFRQAQQISASMAQEQARLQEASDRAAMEQQVRQKALEQQSALQTQELAQTKAYQDAQIGLRHAELQQGQQKIQMAAEQAARKFQAQAAFQQEIGDGSDPQKITRAILKWGAAMGEPGGATAAAIRASAQKPAFVPGAVQAQPVLDPQTKAPMPGFIATPSAGGNSMTVHPVHNPDTQATTGQRLTELRSRRKEILDEYAGRIDSFKPKNEQSRQKWEEDKAELEEIEMSRKALMSRQATTAGTGSGSGAQGDKVIVITPDGKSLGKVPRSRLPEYLKAGYQLANADASR